MKMNSDLEVDESKDENTGPKDSASKQQENIEAILN